jgi:bisphosphoglycerate-independent phosphoglycerate mutase (AlkP superfamily)
MCKELQKKKISAQCVYINERQNSGSLHSSDKHLFIPSSICKLKKKKRVVLKTIEQHKTGHDVSNQIKMKGNGETSKNQLGTFIASV